MTRKAEILKLHRTNFPSNKVVDQYRFRLLGDNGEVIATSEFYTQKHNVISVLDKYFGTFEQIDLTNE